MQFHLKNKLFMNLNSQNLYSYFIHNKLNKTHTVIMYIRTPLIRHLLDWGCGWNAKKVGLSEYKETFTDNAITKCKCYQIYFKYYF
jgi:hypothetical protein